MSMTGKGAARLHIERHYGIYKYNCEVCHKGFSSSALMRAHMAQHTGVKDFKCEFCSREFGYKHVLKTHQRKCPELVRKFEPVELVRKFEPVD